MGKYLYQRLASTIRIRLLKVSLLTDANDTAEAGALPMHSVSVISIMLLDISAVRKLGSTEPATGKP